MSYSKPLFPYSNLGTNTTNNTSTGPTGPKGYTGPTGPSLNIIGPSTGSIVLTDPNDTSNIYYNDVLSVEKTDTFYIKSSGNIIPSENDLLSLGSLEKRWKDLYLGPGTIFIASPTGTTGATIGSDLQGIAYAQYGFSSPFLNVGPAIETDRAVGGWQIYGTGITGPSGTFEPTDLLAIINTPSGPTGQSYSLIFGKSGLTGYTGPTGRASTGPTGQAGTFALTGSAFSNYIYWNGTQWVVGSTKVSIGNNAGNNQLDNAVAIGTNAGRINQLTQTVAIGNNAGNNGQQGQAIAIGLNAGFSSQGSNTVAIGSLAGYTGQRDYAVAVGREAGRDGQGTGAVAIGRNAGQSNQGPDAVAIGPYAGYTNQARNSIALNATSNELNPGNTGFFVNPIRETGSQYALNYNPTTKEITYSLSLTGATGPTGPTGQASTVAGPTGNTGPTGVAISFLGFTATTSSSVRDGTAVLGTVTTNSTTSTQKVLILANVGVNDANTSEIFTTILKYTGATGASNYFNLANQTSTTALPGQVILDKDSSLGYLNGDGTISMTYIDNPGSQSSVSYVFYVNHKNGGNITVGPATMSLLKISP